MKALNMAKDYLSKNRDTISYELKKKMIHNILTTQAEINNKYPY